MDQIRFLRAAAMLVAAGTAVALAINGDYLEAVATIAAAFSSTGIRRKP